ncbi:hypothetical protein [Streptosporangium sp. NPDC002721]|uniref:hypothetical protein n=1 Tax=Streptosporangium sp. NPDC002721 TaxID=3366188 RepID=UPI003686124A
MKYQQIPARQFINHKQSPNRRSMAFIDKGDKSTLPWPDDPDTGGGGGQPVPVAVDTASPAHPELEASAQHDAPPEARTEKSVARLSG